MASDLITQVQRPVKKKSLRESMDKESHGNNKLTDYSHSQSNSQSQSQSQSRSNSAESSEGESSLGDEPGHVELEENGSVHADGGTAAGKGVNVSTDGSPDFRRSPSGIGQVVAALFARCCCCVSGRRSNHASLPLGAGNSAAAIGSNNNGKNGGGTGGGNNSGKDGIRESTVGQLTLSNGYLMPPQRPPFVGRKCLVLDLDETLVHSSFKPVPNADFIVPVEIDDVTHKVYVLKRPGVDSFLERVGELFEVVVFTASLAKYADPVLDLLDTSRVVDARLFREACSLYKGNYVKDLNLLGRDLKDSIIIDNSPHSYLFHNDNAIPCESWFDDPDDTELLDLLPFLESLAVCDNVMTILSKRKRG